MIRSRLSLVCLAARLSSCAPAWSQAQEVAPAHGMAMHGDLKYGPDFEHFDYVNPERAEGRHGDLLGDRHLRQSQSVHHQRHARRPGSRSLFESLTTQSLGRAVLRVRPARRIDRDAGGPLLGGVHAAPGGALARRQAGHGRGRDLELRHAQGEGRAVLSRTTTRTCVGGAGGRAPGQVHLRRDHQPRAAADHRPAADPAQALLRGGRVRPDDAGAAARQRALPDRVVRAGAQRSSTSGSRTTGARICRSTAAATTSTRSATSIIATPTSRSKRSRPAPTTSGSRTPPSSGRPPTPARCSMPAGSSRRRSRTSCGTGMQGFAFNIRRPLFQDPKVREALGYAFDFEWTNRTILYGQYDADRELLLQHRAGRRGPAERGRARAARAVPRPAPEEVFTEVYQAPVDRAARAASGRTCAPRCELLRRGRLGGRGRAAGQSPTGQPFRFEILLNGPSFERITLPFVKNLERLGIEATVRAVDPAQYQNRMDDFDFDMTVRELRPEPVAGQRAARVLGQRGRRHSRQPQLIGIKDPVVDQLVDRIIQAPTREDLVTATRALDRVLLWGHYVIPHWHSRVFRVAYWDKFGRPEINPPYGLPPVQLVGRSGQGGGRGAAQDQEGGAKAARPSSRRRPCWPTSSAGCC